MSEQASLDDAMHGANLARVRERIAPLIVAFMRDHLRVGRQEFHADDLRRYVTAHVGPTAPASTDRILRDLRQRGTVSYRVLSRRASLYRVEAVS